MTKTKGKATTKIKPIAKQSLAQEKVQEIQEGEVKQENNNSPIKRVYLATKTGIEVLEGEDAQEDIKGIFDASRNLEEGDSPYIGYEGGKPVYIAIKNGNYSPLVFPEPGSKMENGQTGMTSMELYSLAVTLACTVERIIELETEPKPSLIDQARKIMTPTLVIVGAIVAIFLIAVMIGG